MGEDKERIQRNNEQDNKPGIREGGDKETIKEETERKTEKGRSKERRSKRDSNKREDSGTAGTAGTEEREDEHSGHSKLHIQEDSVKPEQVILEADVKKGKKKTVRKKKDRIKDDIKLALISVYGVAGFWVDECFFLKPDESEKLSEAIYRYLDEHNLLDAISEKSATLNLLIVFASVNIPKVLTYYNKERKLKQDEKQGRKTTNSDRKPDKPTRSRDANGDNVKTFLDGFYNEYEG